MKYVDEYRDGALCRALAAGIAADVEPGRRYRFMEFCGGHTHAIARYGLEELLPPNVRMVHGPGCPVCVLPAGRVDAAIAVARQPGVTLVSYGDMLRVPGARRLSLLQARSEGCDVRVLYAPADALELAAMHPDRQLVFFAVGFETTTPPTALAVKAAQARGLRNFSVLSNHVLTPAAIAHILDSPEVRELGTVRLDGFLGPSHVSAVIGSQPYEYFAEEYGKPVVVAGFEPVDVLEAVRMLVRQVNEGRAEVENQYRRAVTRAGNHAAQALVADVFELRRSFEWRGLGVVPYSGLRLKAAYADHDAERRFELAVAPAPEAKGCLCGSILRAAKEPADCPLLGKACTPETPVGSCMVAHEGACAAYYRYGRLRPRRPEPPAAPSLPAPPVRAQCVGRRPAAGRAVGEGTPRALRVLMLAQSFNSLTQRLFVELRARGHEVSVELDVNDAVALEAVELAEPDLVLAPFLRRAISAPVWRRQPCLVVHPGPPGDGGASALDRAILEGAREWGVTVLEAEAALDAGPVWASRSFALRDASKGSLYRREVTEAAVEAVLEAVARFPAGRGERPAALRFRPPLRQAERAIDWSRDDTATVLRKIRSADGQPGVLDALAGEAVYLYDATPGVGCPGAAPGALVGRSSEAVCRATADGAVWLGTLRRRDARPSVKLPALAVLGATGLRLPELPGPDAVRYEQANGVGYLSFAFCNGAMSTAQCRRLTDAVAAARACATRVLVLLGGPDFWSNGIHLGVIEAAPSPADESWRNIVAMDDLCRELVTTTSHVVVAALQGNAAAGGVFLALAADRVVARAGVVLNPHYRGMGNLYGSEYWTYLLPRRVGAERARVVTEARLPMGVAEALDLGLVDACLGRTPEELRRAVRRLAEDLVASPELDRLLADKRARRAADEADKPLERYRQEELARMHRSFYGFDSAYHVARHAFVCKVPKARTPRYLATHRQRRAAQ